MQTCMAQLMPLPLNHSLSLALAQITYWTLTSLNITETIIDSQQKNQTGFTVKVTFTSLAPVLPHDFLNSAQIS